MNGPFLRVAFRVWLCEVLISGVNYFVLMKLVYEPSLGELTAHEIGMSTRIVYIFGLSFLFLRANPRYTRRDLVQVGALWLASALTFEWAGSILVQDRPVAEILAGWHIWEGYMWPYVLLAYASANLLVGVLLHPGRGRIASPAPGSGISQSKAHIWRG